MTSTQCLFLPKKTVSKLSKIKTYVSVCSNTVCSKYYFLIINSWCKSTYTLCHSNNIIRTFIFHIHILKFFKIFENEFFSDDFYSYEYDLCEISFWKTNQARDVQSMELVSRDKLCDKHFMNFCKSNSFCSKEHASSTNILFR